MLGLGVAFKRHSSLTIAPTVACVSCNGCMNFGAGFLPVTKRINISKIINYLIQISPWLLYKKVLGNVFILGYFNSKISHKTTEEHSTKWLSWISRSYRKRDLFRNYPELACVAAEIVTRDPDRVLDISDLD